MTRGGWMMHTQAAYSTSNAVIPAISRMARRARLAHRSQRARGLGSPANGSPVGPSRRHPLWAPR
jgi:hypothetical protein